MEELGYWVAFTKVTGIGPMRFRRLLDHFGSMQAAWTASSQALGQAGLDAKVVDAVESARATVSPAREVERLDKAGVSVLTWQDAGYPERLRQIYAPPPVVYLRGSLSGADDWAVAVVGTRRASVYGQEVTRRLAGDLAQSGVTVVSGLARGIDTCAHQAALAAGGRTLAVLGSGVDVIYPRENARLAQSIVENGALISEYPLGTQPEATNFPQRNRIISGLSLGTLVVEADTTSGALITADFANEEGREVFAVPGSILTRGSSGTNRLIQQGAKLVTSVQDILEELNLGSVPQQLEMKTLLPENEVEAALLQLLTSEPTHVDDLVRASALPTATVSAALTMMELKGMVRQIGGMSYVRGR